MNLQDPRIFALALIEARLLGQDQSNQANALVLANIMGNLNKKPGQKASKAMCKKGERADITHCIPKQELPPGETTSTTKEGEERRRKISQPYLPQPRATPGVQPKPPKVNLTQRPTQDNVLMKLARLGQQVITQGPKLPEVEPSWGETHLAKYEPGEDQEKDQLAFLSAGMWFIFRCGSKEALELWNRADRKAKTMAKENHEAVRHLLFLILAKIYQKEGLDLTKVPGFEQDGNSLYQYAPVASLSYLPYLPPEEMATYFQTSKRLIGSVSKLVGEEKAMQEVGVLVRVVVEKKDNFFNQLLFTGFDSSKRWSKAVKLAEEAYRQNRGSRSETL